MKKILLLFLSILACCFISLGFSACDIQETPKNGLTFRTLMVQGDTVYGVVGNSTENFSFKEEVVTHGDTSFIVSLDEYGFQQFITKTIPLEEGDNIVYLFEMLDNEVVHTYTVVIHRSQYQQDEASSSSSTPVEDEKTTEGVKYRLSDDGTYAEVYGYRGTATDVVIADTYEGKPVTSIGNYAFENCSSLTSITIPDSVSSIGDLAFSWCSSLTSISIPDSVTSIGVSAFASCTSLTSISIPDSVSSIGISAFASCSNLQFATYGNAKYLGNENNPYSACIQASNSKFSSYTIHNDTKIIADNAFEICERLTSITIPDSVTSIGNLAFYGCSRLTSVTIGDSVTWIGDRAFEECSSLTSISIPDSVSYIGNYAFEDCSSLTEIRFEGTMEEWNALGYYGWYCVPATKVICSDGEVAL